MASPLVECIPNFSEARRPEVVAEIENAIQSVPGIRILDRHSDLDHNRTVITFVGQPEQVEEAAFQSIAHAARLIDLNHHQGEHPRIGATDVVPFVPLSGIEMDDCVAMARRVGKRVGEDLQIPVYLYEQAATRPDRQNLENIRHGQYEGLKIEIETNPERQPDYGPARLGPAGATVIGARHPLIAFNVYLTSSDVTIAQKIARAIRQSSGGLRFVKALGLLVEGKAQVSMNLTNFHQTPVARVVEMIRREAGRYGVGIHHSELVGLIPQAALSDAALWYLQLHDFEPEQILENRLYSASEFALPEPDFLDRLAAATPTPGGGSAAAYAGAEAAALLAMVARLTVNKEKYAAVAGRMKEIIERTEVLRTQLTQAVEEDAACFEDVMAAYRMPYRLPADREARSEAIQRTSLKAAETPLRVARISAELMRLADEMAASGNLNAISDAASALALAKAALTGAGLNVRINLKGIDQTETTQALLAELADLEKAALQMEAGLRATLSDRAGLSFA